MRTDPPRRKMFDTGLIVLLVLAGTAGGGVLVTRGWERFAEILVKDLGFAVILLPKIVAGVLVASIIPLLLSREWILRWIGPESGLAGLTVATIAGAAVPGGPMVTLPLVTGLMAKGADAGSAVALITGWLMLGLNRTLIWEMSFLPPDLVLTRYALCAPMPILIGLACRALVARKGRGA